MIHYIYAKTLCRKAVARAFRGKIMKAKSPIPEFPVRIKIEPREIVSTLLVCTRNRLDAHTQNDNGCDCRKNMRHVEEAYAFIVPLEPNKEANT